MSRTNACLRDFVSLHLIPCLLCHHFTLPLSFILGLSVSQLSFWLLSCHTSSLGASSSLFLALCPFHPSCSPLLYPPKAPYGIFSHILDDIWILYIVNTISRVSQSIQAFYQFASLTELHFTLEFNDILLQSADRQIHSCTVFRLCLIR